MESKLMDYGVAGVGLLAMGALIMMLLRWIKKMIKDHQAAIERMDQEHRKAAEKRDEDMRKMTEGMFDRVNRMNDDTNRSLRDNTNILSGLKTLLETKK